MFSACAMRLIVRRSLHFVAFGFLFNEITVTSLKFLRHSRFCIRC
jgi:hypothetical protein